MNAPFENTMQPGSGALLRATPAGGLQLPDQRELPRHHCQACGAPARVHILQGYDEAGRDLEHFCLSCAEQRTHADDSEASPWMGAKRPSLAGCLLFAGTLLAVAGTVGETTEFTGHSGFGWVQRSGVALGAIVAICGGLLRIDYFAIGGVLLFIFACGADLLERTGAAGLMWKHVAVIALGLVLILAAMLISGPRRAADNEGDKPCQA